jgi:hypothetical protein
MNFIRKFILFSLFLVPICVLGQGKYTLNGHLHVKDGDTYPYKLVFSIARGDINGYSVTRITDSTETKGVITGHINRKKQILTFVETKVIGEHEPQKDVTNCLIDAKCAYKLHGANYIVIGTFTGKDEDKKKCGDGVLEFQQANTAGSVFYTDTIQQLPVAHADSVAKNELPGENTITAGIQKEYDWISDSCVLDIWDSGVIDGDVVSVLFNGQNILSNYTLAKEKMQLRLRLIKGANTITIVAEDEGNNPPNTAEMLLTDVEARYKITAFNKKGEKAIVVLRKK